MTVLLTVESISKGFPGVQALRDVTFHVEAGTVHAIMGENGAGKSTLMQVIAGALRPDSGRLIFDGTVLTLSGTRDAAAKGISIVFQELMLAPNMSVAENIFLGAEPHAAGVFVDRATMRAKACGGARPHGHSYRPRPAARGADHRPAAAYRDLQISRA